MACGTRFSVVPDWVITQASAGDGFEYSDMLVPFRYCIGDNHNTTMIKIEKYSIGVGDRFAHQARARFWIEPLARQPHLTLRDLNQEDQHPLVAAVAS